VHRGAIARYPATLLLGWLWLALRLALALFICTIARILTLDTLMLSLTLAQGLPGAMVVMTVYADLA